LAGIIFDIGAQPRIERRRIELVALLNRFDAFELCVRVFSHALSLGKNRA
jgi:hypothetical protein